MTTLNKDSPVHQPVQNQGKIVSKSILGGLHHVYTRVAETDGLVRFRGTGLRRVWKFD